MTIRWPPALASRRLSLGISILLFGLVFWAFLPSLRNGFIDYDDAPFVTANPQVQSGLTWKGVAYAFCNPVAANWHPLTTLSHMLDCSIFGLNPWGHHLTNVLLHTLNAVLLFLVFHRMTGAPWRCAALALLFALHPLRVESVAWVSERKDVLSTLFWLLTLLAYARYARNSKVPSAKSKVAYGLALAFFALGLMSKPMLVTLPFVLLLLDYWPLGRMGSAECGLRHEESRNTQQAIHNTQYSTRPPPPFHHSITPLLRLALEKLPFFGLAFMVAVIAFTVQAGAENIKATGQFVFTARLQNALVSYGRYVGKLFWPTDLSPFYPYPAGWGWATVLPCGFALAGISVCVVAWGRRHRYLPTGWFWFVGTLVPVIGLVQIGKQSMADHYTYIPTIGVLLMLVWGAHALTLRWQWRKVGLSGLVVVATLACLALTRRQIGYWKDDETLWRHALAVTGTNELAIQNLGAAYYNQGIALAGQGAFDEAIRYYEKAIHLTPEKDDAHSSLGYAWFKKGDLGKAIREYNQALRLNPTDAEAHNNVGYVLFRQGQPAEAIRHFDEALRLKPDYPEAHDNLGAVLAGQGRYAEAAVHFREALRFQPDSPGTRQKLERAVAIGEKLERAAAPYREALQSNPGDARARGELGRVLLEAGQIEEAMIHCGEAARLTPENPEAQYQLGAVLARKGEAEEAGRQFELALRLEPAFVAAHYALGIVRQQQGRTPEAIGHWREAVRLAPQWSDPLNNLAWAMATDARVEVRDGAEAVRLAEQAVELSGTNNVGVLDTLAAAYAEAGRFEEASVTARRAQAAATTQGLEVLASQIGERLALYSSRQPYRQPRDLH
ncbi:MAG TPA: tetratricopeptide repeat protein [Candidatus Paceibacterota bacterium]|nr:tetratricopeptide repeat protein [Verrucomicrobiota bacterium]HSA10385.1 tetratricopeptide repeat protein [Candidatus Paceibacterota bacterium]